MSNPIKKLRGSIQSPKARYVGRKNSLPRFPIEAINVMNQVRQTFDPDEQRELAENISQFNLLQPLSLAIFDEDHMIKHLKLVNKAWGTRFSLSRFKKQVDGTYAVLIAGERRLRSIKEIILNATNIYSQQFFKDRQVAVVFHYNIPSLTFISIQVSENIHRRPPAHEEAAYFEKYYRALKVLRGKKFSVAEFAREIGRSAQSVGQAIKFCYLPTTVRKFVEQGMLSYTIACELIRLQANGVGNQSLKQWAIDSIVYKYTTKNFQKAVSNFLLRQASNGLFDDFSKASELAQYKENRKRALNIHVRLSLADALKYLFNIRSLEEKGLIGKDSSPFGSTGAYKGVGKLVETLKTLIPYIKDHLHDPYFAKVLKEIKHEKMIEKINSLEKAYKKII